MAARDVSKLPYGLQERFLQVLYTVLDRTIPAKYRVQLKKCTATETAVSQKEVNNLVQNFSAIICKGGLH